MKITADYISYEGWDRKGAERSSNDLYISRLRVIHDSLLDPFSNPGQSELLDKLETDSSFICFAKINLPKGESYRNKRIYFDRDNGFSWRIGIYPADSSVPTIGRLQAGQWYKIAGLSYNGISTYVYVDSARQVHEFGINQANW